MDLVPVQTILAGCNVDVGDMPDGNKAVVVSHPSGLQWVIPLSEEACQFVAAKLVSGLTIATELPQAG